MNEALGLLKDLDKRLDDSSWPQPLIGICLGKRDVDLDLSSARYARYSRIAVANFYKNLLELRDGALTREQFADSMRGISDVSRSELAETRAFTSLVWRSEFFIARHEGTRGRVARSKL